MDLIDFYSDFQNTVVTTAEVEEIFTADAFVEEVSRRMTEVEEIDSITVSRFEGTGAKQKKVLLNGFDFGDEEGHAVFVVSDYSTSNEIETLSLPDARKLFSGLEAFVENSLDGKILQLIEESSPAYSASIGLYESQKTIFKIRLYLLTNKKLSDRVKDFPSVKIGGLEVEFHLWDIERLYRVQTSQLGREDIDIDLTEWESEGIPALRTTAVGQDLQTYLAVLPGELLASIYEKYGSRLLEANVRSFLTSRGNVNRGIRGTIQQEPAMFLAYNNGLAATAAEVNVDTSGIIPKIKSIKNLQIVNGGQTTASLFYVRKNDKADLSDVFVQMKLIVVDESRASELVPLISRYANTQNKVSEADFFSNHPFHVRMEEKSRRILAPAKAGTSLQTKWFYERTRGQYINEKAKVSISVAKRLDAEFPKAQVITKTDAAKYLVSWDQAPHIVSSGAQKNFIAFADGIAKQWAANDAVFGDEYFQGLVSKGILFNSIRLRVMKSDWYSSGYLANIVTYTVAKIAHDIKATTGGELDFGSIWKQQTVSEELWNAIEPIAKLALKVLTDPNRPVDNVTEWAKREKCWEILKGKETESLSLLLQFASSKNEMTAQVNAAKKLQKVDNGIEAQTLVVNLGQKYWVNLKHFALKMGALSPKEKSILAYATGEAGRPPSEAQALVLIEVRQRLEAMGFAGN